MLKECSLVTKVSKIAFFSSFIFGRGTVYLAIIIPERT